MLKDIHKIHFVGIGGAGMSALAKILVEKGYEVSGSDLHGSELVEKLKELGAKVYEGQAAEHVHGVDAIVVSTAIRDTNPEVVEAQLAHGKSGPLGAAYDRAEYLAQRRTMMQTWADYLDKLRQGADVIAFKAA